MAEAVWARGAIHRTVDNPPRLAAPSQFLTVRLQSNQQHQERYGPGIACSVRVRGGGGKRSAPNRLSQDRDQRRLVGIVEFNGVGIG